MNLLIVLICMNIIIYDCLQVNLRYASGIKFLIIHCNFLKMTLFSGTTKQPQDEVCSLVMALLVFMVLQRLCSS